MPLMQNIPYRIVSEANLKQCLFWLAYDQTPLYPDHEDLRNFAVEKAFLILDESQDMQRAKDQLLLYLREGRLSATGCKGHAIIDETGQLVSDIQTIDLMSWHSKLSTRNWDDSSIGHPAPGGDLFISHIMVVTADLFRAFPHDDMTSVLEGCENMDIYLKEIGQKPNKDAPIQRSVRTDNQQKNSKTLQEFHSGRVEYFRKIRNCSRKNAAKLAASDEPDPDGPNKKKYTAAYIERNDRIWRNSDSGKTDKFSAI